MPLIRSFQLGHREVRGTSCVVVLLETLKEGFSNLFEKFAGPEQMLRSFIAAFVTERARGRGGRRKTRVNGFTMSEKATHVTLSSSENGSKSLRLLLSQSFTFFSIHFFVEDDESGLPVNEQMQRTKAGSPDFAMAPNFGTSISKLLGKLVSDGVPQVRDNFLHVHPWEVACGSGRMGENFHVIDVGTDGFNGM